MNDKAVAERLAGLVGELGELASQVGDDGDRVDVIAGLERLKAAAAAAQLSVVSDFAVSQEAANKALGVEERVARRGVPEQVGLARKVAPASAARQVSHANALRQDLPGTFGLLAAGEISEWVATIVVNETSHLAGEDRRLVDKRLAGELSGLSPGRARGRAQSMAYEVDPAGAVKRKSNARKDRRVWMRPAPDTMAVLSALVPCEQGVAAWAALRRHADRVVGSGDGRSRDQVMADTVVERLTGQATAEQVDAEIGLVMSESSLFGGDEQPAELSGYGPIPAELARGIAARADGVGATGEATGGGGGDAARSGGGASEAEGARVWLRRLVTDPVTGVVADCDPRRRRFTGVLARMLVYRDQRCRNPYCDAPIRHLDHIQRHADGGPTTSSNGQGLCERCNYVRQMPGWHTEIIDPDHHTVQITTPTGHTYQSRPPPTPGTHQQREPT